MTQVLEGHLLLFSITQLNQYVEGELEGGLRSHARTHNVGSRYPHTTSDVYP